MIAVGDVKLEIALCLTVRGTVKELAGFMESLSSSELVVRFARADSDGKKHEVMPDLAKQLCSDKEERER